MTKRATRTAVASAAFGLSFCVLARAEAPAALTQRVFQRMDQNHDGRVTRQEAEDAGRRLFERFDDDADGAVTRAEANAGARALRAEELAARFRELDESQDGRLSGTESRLPPKLFLKLDANRDRALSLEEFQARPDYRAEHGFELERMDANRDGKVSRDEADRSFGKRFERADLDRDGVITRAELDAQRASSGTPGRR